MISFSQFSVVDNLTKLIHVKWICISQRRDEQPIRLLDSSYHSWETLWHFRRIQCNHISDNTPNYYQSINWASFGGEKNVPACAIMQTYKQTVSPRPDYLQIKSMALITCNYNFISLLFLHLFAFLCLIIIFVNVLSQNNIFRFGYARTINACPSCKRHTHWHRMHGWLAQRKISPHRHTQMGTQWYMNHEWEVTTHDDDDDDDYEKAKSKIFTCNVTVTVTASPVSPKHQNLHRIFRCDSFDQIKQICIHIPHYINKIWGPWVDMSEHRAYSGHIDTFA